MPQGLCRRFLVTAYQYSVTVFVLFGAATNVVDSQPEALRPTVPEIQPVSILKDSPTPLSIEFWSKMLQLKTQEHGMSQLSTGPNNCRTVHHLQLKINVKILSEQNLEGLLTKSEWLSIIGNSNSEKPKFSITYPNHYPPNEKDDLVHRLQINVPNFGRNFDLELVPNRNLVTDDLRILETFTNGSTRSLGLDEGESSDCYFRGDRAALSLCGGVVKGIVHTDQEEYYIIHPLPKRFHNESGTSPHVIVRRKHSNACHHHLSRRHLSILPKNDSLSWQKTKDMNHINDNNNSKNIPKTKDILRKKSKINESSLKHYNSRTKREIIFPLGTPVFVETAVFVDRDLFDHMKSNYPVDTERELIRFVLAMINAVQLLYHDPSLGRPVNFVLKRLEIMKEEAAGLLRPPDIDRFLSNFCTWQRTRNPAGDREPQHWDHALILTGLDLYVRGKHGKISNQVVGLAPVAGMCTATSSCTVNEGRHFESVYVVAHEIGHNLGMRHDGPLADNDCDPTSYIMSPTLGSGKITWSPCSRRYLQTFLETSQSRCLLDHGSSAGQLDHSAEGALPGERFDSNQQCMLKYGRGSRHSSQQPLDDVCRDLHCERERYTWTSHPALEGTMCGHNMWCRGGRCLARGYPVSAAYTNSNSQSGSSHPSRSESIVPGGWSKWRSYSDCASGCLFGEEGRLRSGSTGIMVSTRMCNSPRPQNGGDYCQGVSKRYQACNSQQCLNVPRLTVKEFAEQICTRAKDVDKDLTGSGMQKISSDSEEACLVWCQKRNGGTKSRGWTFPDGTVCQTTSSPTTTSGSNGHVTTTTTKNRYYSNKHLLTTDGYCINGRCEEFTCDPYNEDENVMFAQMAEMCPKPTPPPPSLNSKNNQNGGGSRNNNNLDRNDDFDYKNNNNKNADNNNYNEIIFKTGLSRTRPQNSQNGFYNTGGIIKWKSASGCHFNCISPGTGIRLVVSKGKYSKSSIQLCQPDQFGCSRIKSPFQHASMICNKYKERVRRLSGLGMQISPVLEDPDRPCRVACQDENISHRFYLVNGEEGWFPFGTDCSRNSASTTSSSSSSVTTVDKKAFCISGKCLEFGQDDTPLSQSEFTLPLLSRSRRSLQKNNTRVTAKLDQRQLDEIVHALNRTLTGGTTATRNGNFRPSDYRFDIDLDNPVHVNMDEDPSTNVQYYNNYNDYNSRDYNNYGRSQDYWNYA